MKNKIKYTKAETVFYTAMLYAMLKGIGWIIFSIAFLILVVGLWKWLL